MFLLVDCCLKKPRSQLLVNGWFVPIRIPIPCYERGSVRPDPQKPATAMVMFQRCFSCGFARFLSIPFVATTQRDALVLVRWQWPSLLCSAHSMFLSEHKSPALFCCFGVELKTRWIWEDMPKRLLWTCHSFGRSSWCCLFQNPPSRKVEQLFEVLSYGWMAILSCFVSCIFQNMSDL